MKVFPKAEKPPVDSVNGQTGAVNVDTDDVAEGSTNLYHTDARVSANADVIANTAAAAQNATDIANHTHSELHTPDGATPIVSITPGGQVDIVAGPLYQLTISDTDTSAAATSGILFQARNAAGTNDDFTSIGNANQMAIMSASANYSVATAMIAVDNAGNVIMGDYVASRDDGPTDDTRVLSVDANGIVRVGTLTVSGSGHTHDMLHDAAGTTIIAEAIGTNTFNVQANFTTVKDFTTSGNSIFNDDVTFNTLTEFEDEVAFNGGPIYAPNGQSGLSTIATTGAGDAFTISGGLVTGFVPNVPGPSDLVVPFKIEHDGDPDTFIQFDPDTITFSANNGNMCIKDTGFDVNTTMNVDGTANFIQDMNVDGAVIMSNTLDVGDTATFTGESEFQDLATFSAEASFDSDVRAPNGNLGLETIVSNSVGDDITVSGGLITAFTPGDGSITNLSDVDTTTLTPANGDILIYDGTNWVPSNTLVDSMRKKHVFSNSCRVYGYTNNRWVYPSTAYGPSYFQWNANGGTAATPSTTWAYNGTMLPAGTVLKRIIVKGRSQNAQLTGLKVFMRVANGDFFDPALAIDTNAEAAVQTVLAPTDALLYTAGNSQDMRATEISLNDYVLVNDQDLHLYFQPQGTLTATRYYYLTYMIEVELP